VHYGGAYGHGTTESGIGFAPGAARTIENLASSRFLPAGLVSRARIILLSASGKTIMQIARQLGLTNATVGKWRRRFVEQDVSGLHDEFRSTAAIPRALHSDLCLVVEPSGDLVQPHHQQAIGRGTFRSVKDLVEKIDHYVQNSNRHAQPFVWTATADSIFAKIQRRCERISGTAH
jgi:transposase-like protein